MHVLQSCLVLTALLTTAAAVAAQNPPPAAPRPPGMALVSSAFPDGDPIPAKYTQAVQAPVSPPLSWTNVPAGTQSFVLFMRDPDVAMARGTEDFLHWLLWNIPGSKTSLPEGVPSGDLPDGTKQTSGRGPAYIGPGAGANGPVHHYTFELYALDNTLNVTPGATGAETKAAVLEAMKGHVLGKAVYVGLFKRPAQ